MKRSKALLTGALMGTAYLVFLLALGFMLAPDFTPGARVTVFEKAQDITFITIHAACVLAAVVFNWIGFAKNGRFAALMGGISYAAAAVALYVCAPFVLVQMVLSVTACAAMRRTHLPEAVPGSAMLSGDGRMREGGDKPPRRDALSTAMTVLAALLAAAVVCVLAYGVSENKAAFERIGELLTATPPPEEVDSPDGMGDMGEDGYMGDDGYFGEQEYTGEDEYTGDGEFTGGRIYG